MAEPTPGTPVIDRRTHPRGALPRTHRPGSWPAWRLRFWSSSCSLAVRCRLIAQRLPRHRRRRPVLIVSATIRTACGSWTSARASRLRKATPPMPRAPGVADARPSPVDDPHANSSNSSKKRRSASTTRACSRPTSSQARAISAGEFPTASRATYIARLAARATDAGGAVTGRRCRRRYRLRVTSAPLAQLQAGPWHGDWHSGPSAKHQRLCKRGSAPWHLLAWLEGTWLKRLIEPLRRQPRSPVSCLVTNAVYASDRETVLIPPALV